MLSHEVQDLATVDQEGSVLRGDSEGVHERPAQSGRGHGRVLQAAGARMKRLSTLPRSETRNARLGRIAPLPRRAIRGHALGAVRGLQKMGGQSQVRQAHFPRHCATTRLELRAAARSTT